MYRKGGTGLEVFIAHPGGPFFKNKDAGHWTIPKGEVAEGEDLLETAKREFKEETGIDTEGDFIELGQIKQKGGKIVHAWAFEANCAGDVKLCSNLFEIEWPPKSGKFASFPEVDRAGFFSLAEAKVKLKNAQHPLLERLVEVLKSG